MSSSFGADAYSLKTIRVEVAKGVAWAIFENPPINLVDEAMKKDLVQFLDQVADDDAVRVIVFESADPDFFLAHLDVTGGASTPSNPPFSVAIAQRLARLPKVSIAKIAGRARGAGSEIALACDMRFASLERAILGQPEVAVGLFPGGGGIQRLPRLIGRGRSLEVILGADDFPASVAERYGWVNRALPDAELDLFVDQLACRIASFPAEALATAKKLVDKISLPDDAVLAAENRLFWQAMANPEARRRLQRMLEDGLQTRGRVEKNLGWAIAGSGGDR
ncbi:enoyl-CoA hydratase/isomerase family protein [Nocardia pseudobrasiliensis]|uniref:Enoyl-CoA hydratase/carnithine racemase n=1 Tax=Nocardia pseudobrasiliensis TaxID=45979 RepID=A0A370I877_9NOCA|nr:enoyl-CoA hydratase/isomerase family protein [Nocardia pseudobrasiliensis]RDI66935.1 enoyl-CoA hydratase/carnithine racemase [Nocardia pseudobrasiliensis]